jgi:hypothetical protein
MRYSGEGAWRSGYSPLSLQAAFGSARVLSTQNRFAEEFCVFLAVAPPPRLLDIRI